MMRDRPQAFAAVSRFGDPRPARAYLSVSCKEGALTAPGGAIGEDLAGCGKTLILGGAALPALRNGHSFNAGFSP
jgi:hypothetical protein